MKKVWLMQILCLMILLLGNFIFTTSMLSAQSSSFAQVTPFSTLTGLFGFFDQRNGKIYLYDRDFKECLFQFELEELGKPIKKLQN